jgi:hypothetical protein
MLRDGGLLQNAKMNWSVLAINPMSVSKSWIYTFHPKTALSPNPSSLADRRQFNTPLLC